MPKRFATLAALLGGAALLLGVLPAAPASAASPWWQLTTSSRPTNLWEPKDDSEVQKIETELLFGVVFAAKVEVGGEVVGCLAKGSVAGLCEPETGFPPGETAEDLEEFLEAPYGAGVEVTGGPVGGEPFEVTTPGEWVLPVRLSIMESSGFLLGSASTAITSEGSGELVFTALNLGNAPVDASEVPVTITDDLPAGVAAYAVEARTGGTRCTLQTTRRVSCRLDGSLAPYTAIEVRVHVAATDVTASEPGRVVVSGGDARRLAASQPVAFGEETPFGIHNVEVRAEEEGGDPATQAGSHPFQLTTTLQFNEGRVLRSGSFLFEEQPALPRNLRFKLPAGLVGDASELPRCSYADFTTVRTGRKNTCPDSTAIGVAWVRFSEPTAFGFERLGVPVFNLPPGPGKPARFGIFPLLPITLDPVVRSGESYVVQMNLADISQLSQLFSSTVSFWGNPGDPSHDTLRGWECVGKTRAGTTTACAGPEEKPFLRLPTSCSGPLDFSMEAEPWNVPLGSEISTASFTGTALDGCNRVPFDARLSIASTTSSANSPSGLSVDLTVPQGPSEAPRGVAVSDVKNTTVALPEGLKVNPAAANGLQACSESQVGFSHVDPESGEAVFDESPAQCPEASKLGTVEITTPLLDEPVTGAVYQAAQEDNPFGSLLAIYVVADAPRSGILVKLAGKVVPQADGQLVSTFRSTPQLPFERFELDFFGGVGGPLATSGCGTYETRASIEPWSGGPAVTPSSRFEVSSGAGGGACQSPGPFEPSFEAGTESPVAGAFSPFVLRVRRDDAEQRLRRIDTVLPPGLTGKLAGIPYCSEAQIARAQSLDSPGEGQAELDDPSCPEASKLGVVGVAAGVGPDPVAVQGTAYLAGPYKGAPLSMVIVTAAVTGPFDLGTVVVRVALHVDPVTAQITAKSDPIPQILHGIPLAVRRIALQTDRPQFTLNPTSCREMAVNGTATSALGRAASLASRFQVGGCRGLDFSPRLFTRLFGGVRRGAHPALRAVLLPRPGHANIGRAAVALPRSEFLDQGNIRTVCTRVQFAAEECPRQAIYGRAVAKSPLVDFALRGPVYLRSSDNKLPDLVADLRGPARQPIRIELVGRIDSVRGGIRTTFERPPDVPVSAFALLMKGGKQQGLLVNSRNTCAGVNRARANFIGHNGARHLIRPALRNTRCAKLRRKARQARRAKRAAAAGRGARGGQSFLGPGRSTG